MSASSHVPEPKGNEAELGIKLVPELFNALTKISHYGTRASAASTGGNGLGQFLLRRIESHSMNYIGIGQIRSELRRANPGCKVKVADDQREMVTEISDGLAVAVIERSQAHFHLQTQETHRDKPETGSLRTTCRWTRLDRGDLGAGVVV